MSETSCSRMDAMSPRSTELSQVVSSHETDPCELLPIGGGAVKLQRDAYSAIPVFLHRGEQSRCMCASTGAIQTRLISRSVGGNSASSPTKPTDVRGSEDLRPAARRGGIARGERSNVSRPIRPLSCSWHWRRNCCATPLKICFNITSSLNSRS
jgi:hypothetical protein